MKAVCNRIIALILVILVVPCSLFASSTQPTIKRIVVEGNKYVTSDAILKRLPFKPGEPFDAKQSAMAIKNVYDLGQFRQIRIEKEAEESDELTLFVVVEEKKLVEKIVLTGNKALKDKEIREKLALDKITSVDEETLRRIAVGIEKLYQEEDKHSVAVTFKLEDSLENADKAVATLTINEGPKSLIKRVHFVGNKKLSDRKLRTSIFTRENWLLSFMDSAGSYNKEMLDMDKHRIEYLYRDFGYIQAKVFKVDIVFENKQRDIAVTFHIKEGRQFNVRALTIEGDEVHTSDELIKLCTLEANHPFSQAKLVHTMNKIKDLYGTSGYIYTDVYPQIMPDESTGTVDITLHIDRGSKLYANRIIITGNNVTKDKVVRRQLDIVEGDLITTKKMSNSQSAVEYLSFFERDGVQWRIHRTSDHQADLELNLKEAKTGSFNMTMNYGTDQYNSTPSLRGGIVLEKANLFGQGWDVGAMIQSDRHHVRKMEAHFFDPHLFDSDVSGGIFVYRRLDNYEQWQNVTPSPEQKVLGGNIRLGFLLPQIAKRLQLVTELGIENITNNKPQAMGMNAHLFEPIVRRTFQTGTLKWIGADLVKDIRNHQVYPTEGYKVTLSSRLAPPGINGQFSYFKYELEGSHYTALIGDDSLVLGLHAKGGHISAIDKSLPVPYKELFHMGGQNTVRGFVWGSIGPAWINNDPLGAKNAIQLNTELIFPLIPDYSMKAHVFYDAGAGWNTPKDGLIAANMVKRDKFNLRHSIGFGLNLLKPMPAKIDWGFKLDRNKAAHESPSEFHLSMNYAW
ncbi:outer membrane protein assembly factor BamA [Candidatus Dependentiae bacterium]|nr:outer membrane protein assembly factor BamA [Candidatus Dependentiae bacterium]